MNEHNQDTLLKELMAIDFTIIELNLYLDTHPCDYRALSLFNENVNRAKILRNNYEQTYGPLTASNSFNTKQTWQWINSPWPWEKR